MLKLNGNPVNITKFPDNTSQVWKLNLENKKSQKGAVAVVRENGVLTFRDGLYHADVVPGNLLVEVFRDGKLLVEENLSTIRGRLS